MKHVIQKLLSAKCWVALLGLYCAALLMYLLLYYWVAGWVAPLLTMSAEDIRYEGLLLILVVTIVRSILIWRGTDSAANWVNRDK